MVLIFVKKAPDFYNADAQFNRAIAQWCLNGVIYYSRENLEVWYRALSSHHFYINIERTDFIDNCFGINGAARL